MLFRRWHDFDGNVLNETVAHKAVGKRIGTRCIRSEWAFRLWRLPMVWRGAVLRESLEKRLQTVSVLPFYRCKIEKQPLKIYKLASLADCLLPMIHPFAYIPTHYLTLWMKMCCLFKQIHPCCKIDPATQIRFNLYSWLRWKFPEDPQHGDRSVPLCSRSEFTWRYLDFSYTCQLRCKGVGKKKKESIDFSAY